jgi:hypothetical protein
VPKSELWKIVFVAAVAGKACDHTLAPTAVARLAREIADAAILEVPAEHFERD